MTNNRKTKKGRSSSPSSSQSSRSSMNKSPHAMERLISKSKKGSKTKNKQSLSLLANTVIGVVTLFLASAVISIALNSPSIQNLATVMPQNSVRMMQSNTKPFGGPPPTQANSGFVLSSPSPPYPTQLDMQVPSPGNAGHMFAQARSTEAGHAKNTVMNNNNHNGQGDEHLISLDSDFIVATPSQPKARNYMDHGEMSRYLYDYYYYDSSSQAFHLHDEYTTFPDKHHKPAALSSTSNFQSSLPLSGKHQPTLCQDGITYGFSDLGTLRNAIHELNDAYNHAVSRWNHYNSALSEYELIRTKHSHQHFGVHVPGGQDGGQPGEIEIEAPPSLPQHLFDILEIEPDSFVICPHVTLRPPLGRYMPIHINAEDVVVECDSCVIDTPGTHFSFGQYAKNIVVRGITLMGATESSVIFRNNGAEVSFEDCYWVNNQSIGMHGAVADMNSTSTVKFYRCEISDVKQTPPRPGMQGVQNTVASSLTLRN